MSITKFVPELWSPVILQNLRDTYIYPRLCNHDYEGLIQNAGDTVRLTVFTDPSVSSYTKYNDISWEILADSEVVLNIDQSDYFAFKVDDIDRAQALPGFMERAAVGSAASLAKETDDFIADLMVAAILDDTTYDLQAQTGDLSDSSTYAIFVNLRKQLNKNNCPAAGRWVVVPPEVEAYLLQDARFITASAAGTTAGLRDGAVGRIAGFDVFVSNTVPTVAASATTHYVLAGHPMAVTFADQINKVEAVRLLSGFEDGVRGLHLYGGKVVEKKALAMAHVALQA